jgi:DNA-binding beta-propeller fold protein YncE
LEALDRDFDIHLAQKEGSMNIPQTSVLACLRRGSPESIVRPLSNSIWRFLGGIALSLFTVLPGIAGEQVYVVNSKKPSVAIVDVEQWKTVASIPIDAEPGWAETGPNGRFLYIVHRGPTSNVLVESEDQPSKLTVIDVEKRETVNTIPLPWRVIMVAFSEDSRYLVLASRGKIHISRSLLNVYPQPQGDKKSGVAPEDTGSLTFVDTQTNKIALSAAIGRYPRQVLWKKDVSRAFVLAAGSLYRAKSSFKDPDPQLTALGLVGDDQKLFILRPGNELPEAEIPMDARASSMVLSNGEEWIYVLQSGTPPENVLHRSSLAGKYEIVPLNPAGKKKEYLPGRLLVVDVATAKKTADYEVGAAPRGLHLDSRTGTLLLVSQAGPEDYSGKLYRVRGEHMLPPLDVGLDPQFPVRCPDEPGIRIVSTEDVRLLNDNGQWIGEPLLLNRIFKKGESTGKQTQLYLGDSPAMPICLPKENTLAVITKLLRFGMLDLSKNKLAQFYVSGAAAGGLLSAFAQGLSGGPLEGGGMIPLPPARRMDLMNAEQMGSVSVDRDSGPWPFVPRPDGAFLYLFDGASGKVGIVDVNKNTVLKNLRFGMGCKGIHRPPGGKFVFGVHSGSVTVIDTTTNQELKIRVQKETIRDAVTCKQGTQLLVFADTFLQVVDPLTGKILGTVSGLNQPRFVVEPRHISP